MRQQHVGRRGLVPLPEEFRERRTADLDGLDGLEDARRVLRGRLERLAARSVALLRAGTDLAAVAGRYAGNSGDSGVTSRSSPSSISQRVMPIDSRNGRS